MTREEKIAYVKEHIAIHAEILDDETLDRLISALDKYLPEARKRKAAIQEIMAMEPSLEMDVVVCERVLGWTMDRDFEGDIVPDVVPRFSRDVESAMDLIMRITNKAEQDGGGPLVRLEHDGDWHVSISKTQTSAPKLPLAICRAVLLTLIEEE